MNYEALRITFQDIFLPNTSHVKKIDLNKCHTFFSDESVLIQ